jgi:hypothetical protein
MALVKGVNSYADMTEANTYFENKLDVAAWTDAPETQKNQALCTATSLLDEFEWIGIATSATQSLAFPRKDAEYFDPKIGMPVVLLSTTIPLRIVTATFELAYHLLNNDGLLDDAGHVKNLSVGEIALNVIVPPSKFPKRVRVSLAPLLRNSGKNSWWRAN